MRTWPSSTTPRRTWSMRTRANRARATLRSRACGWMPASKKPGCVASASTPMARCWARRGAGTCADRADREDGTVRQRFRRLPYFFPCGADGRRMGAASAPEQPASVAGKDHGLLLFGQAQPRQSLDVRRQPHLRVVRTDQHLVDPDVAQGPDELVPDRRVGGEQQGAGNIEIEVVEVE